MKHIPYYIVLAALCAACDPEQQLTLGGEEVRTVATITFDCAETLPLAVGQDSALVYHVGPETADDLTIVFKSSNEAVATVSQDGVIHAVRTGDAIISATPPIGFGAEAAVAVKVIPELIKAQTITLTNTTPVGEDGEIFVTDQLQIAADIQPADHTYDRLTWQTSDQNVLTVDDNGLVNCVGAGTARVLAYANDHSGVHGELELTVKPYIEVEGVQIADITEPVCLTRGDINLNVTYSPANGTLGSVEWQSSDEAVATVHRGIVHPVGFGKVSITAKCTNGTTASVSLNITPGWWIWDTKNQWNSFGGWICSNTQAADERLAGTWRIHFPDAGSGKWRRDIKVDCSKQKPFTMYLKDYPVLAIRCDKQKGGNSTLDAVPTEGKLSGGINPKDGIELADGTRLLIYNIGSQLEGKDQVDFSIFQFKMADIPNANVSRDHQYYDIYWIRTFHSEQEAKDFAAAEGNVK